MRKFFRLLSGRHAVIGLTATFLAGHLQAQTTFPVNGIAAEKQTTYAFTHATLIVRPGVTIQDATLLVKDGRIVAAGEKIQLPVQAMVVDCKGKYIYPSFIDLYSDYGLPVPERPSRGFNFSAPAQLTSNQKGAYGWNQAIRSDISAAALFVVDDSKAKNFRDQGFGTVLTHQKDGIARGTGTLATLANEKENKVILKERAAAFYSFSKGSSTQSYPTSLMGSIALLRQSFIDGKWYASRPAKEGLNLSLQAWNNNQALPGFFEANDKWMAVRADRIGDEFSTQFIIKGGGNEYQRIADMKATGATFILPLNFPQAMDVEDPNDARFVSLADMKHWELAPTNPAAFEKAGIPFCLTAADLKDTKQFLASLRKAIEYGLTENKALEALTITPAAVIGTTDVGTLEPGKWANFLITSGPVFQEKTIIYQNWVQGEKYAVNESGWSAVNGLYTLTLTGAQQSASYLLEVKSATSARLFAKDTIDAKFSSDGKFVRISFPETKNGKKTTRLSGVNNDGSWQGTGEDTAGNKLLWTAVFKSDVAAKADSIKKKAPLSLGKIQFPFNGYGWDTLPVSTTILIRNATVWTNEGDGKIEGADVLVKDGKIAAVGKSLSAAGAQVIDGTGKHLTPGIIDEHSHIAAMSINEGAQSVTSEVRIADNLNPEDINIYRQLSGGVTSSHILHGSANTIGGQTQLIKLRWGSNPEALKFAGADPFIKFALGENVKRTSSSQNNRFPDSRMGVEEVLADAFTRARDYEAAIRAAGTGTTTGKGKKVTADPFATVRRDLELDALVEILNSKRFITCHSYVQSEITAAMRVGDRFGFRFNTFTHILEGYKVADKMKAHGANASTFSDWWAYKMEVVDAIPYNAGIMQQVGLNVAINSDDAEMARRLNQEAAKSVKYSGMSEEDALKMVTLNPAKMLHVDNKVGSIKVGKDADLVLWSDNPLSIYAKAEKTIVDGIIYFDRTRDLALRAAISAERSRLVQKMAGEKKGGVPTVPAQASMEIMQTCSEHFHRHGLLVVDGEQANNQ
ncbi:amidohydrolase family protein [Flavihumibacter petaseus]|uniref:Putative hydrolase n=1 Tax=Flavihumibacter petaseus NBRC 106054 TaxID=1220578 RepID=A0A0E9N4S6_9BACT|nr:amidohydrolase family protein [Flavihumibacter petaseus]GAO44803.1 putative hydrolase [Flavihumibacter petaseus NBRC 106054]